MTTADARARSGWLAYWRLSAADRGAVRRIERTCRAVGDPRLDEIALARLGRAARPRPPLRAPRRDETALAGLGRAARRARLLGPLRQPFAGAGPSPQE